MRRQRADGSWTFTTAEWDRAWYWPVGTRVELVNGERGTVAKMNSTTATVVLDSGKTHTRVPFRGLRRV